MRSYGRVRAAMLLAASFFIASVAAQAQHGRQGHNRPKGTPLDSAVVPPADTMTGCSAFDVHLTGGTIVSAVRTVGLPCGPIEPVLAGVPRYDNSRGIVTMQVALINRGAARLHVPVALVALEGGLTVTGGAPAAKPAAAPPVAAPPPPPPTPPQAAGKPGTVVLVGGATPLSASAPGAAPVDPLHFVGVDAQTDTSPAAPRAVRWSFDSSMTRPSREPIIADDGSPELGPGDTTAVRAITVVVPKGVTAFRVNLQGSGLYVWTVPRRAPDTVPRDEVEDSRSPDNLVTDDPRFPGHVVRNKLWVMFRQDATLQQRQAAVDAVSGVVIGGMARGANRYYYLRIPANPDSGATALQRALRTLAPMPQVQDVMPDRGTG